MGVVNTTPTGLLDLLAAKTGGKMPGNMSETLQPVLSLDQFYKAKKLAQVNMPALSTSAVLANSTITVPDGELWEVFALSQSWLSVTGAEVIGTHWTFAQLPESAVPTNGQAVWAPDIKTATVAGLYISQALLFPTPMLLSAGCKITDVCLHRTATVSVNPSVGYFKYRV